LCRGTDSNRHLPRSVRTSRGPERAPAHRGGRGGRVREGDRVCAASDWGGGDWAWGCGRAFGGGGVDCCMVCVVGRRASRPQQGGQLNGYMVMIGGWGAVTAPGPGEVLLAWMGWRGLFELLTAATVLTSIVIYLVVPERGKPVRATSNAGTLKIVFQDGRFWRM